jgi:hypothetical protein
MKKLITVLSVFTAAVILTLPIAPNSLIAGPVSAGQDQCTPEAKNALYQSFLGLRKSDQAKAFELANKYLACPEPTDLTGDQKKIVDYLKKFSAAYAKAVRKERFRPLLYNEQKYAEAYALGQEILTAEPENLQVLIDLGANGYLVAPLGNPQLTASALEYARKALQHLDSGRSLDDWQPLGSKDVAIAYLNYTIGALSLQKEPANALKNLLKAAQFETPLKKSPYTYAYIAGAYETGPYARQSEEYKRIYSGKDETPESKLALANINQLVDRMIDGYARAVALAGDDPKFAKPKAGWMESLTAFYTYRKIEPPMNELIAGILSKPLPPEPTSLTSLPPSTPAPKPE